MKSTPLSRQGSRPARRLLRIYEKLLKTFGPQGWWPAEISFEMMVGAFLTQTTSWSNAELALDNLKAAGILSPEGISACRHSTLARLIRPSGYFNLKAKRLKSYVRWFIEACDGKTENLCAMDLAEARSQLLKVYGVGPETADSILLYAAGHPTFVVDAYTRRIFSRLGCFKEKASYEEMRAYFMKYLPAERQLYNEYHALIVVLGKNHCQPRPQCGECPLRRERHTYRQIAD
ncbi:MAG: endonuclease III domain-containing protein [Planctomycetes bacterium]|nr:endonuclease III domain-containing protein [Planctomycetota bacterium]